MCSKDDDTIAGLMASKKRTALDAKADCSFKFQRDNSNAEDLLRKSGRGNKTIVRMIAIVKQVVLASKKVD